MAAFVSGISYGTIVQAKTNTLVSGYKASPVSRRSARTIVALKEPNSSTLIEEKQKILRDAEDLERKGGFSEYAERVNGRMAMLGFVLALVTEVVAPSHPSLVQQIFAMFPIEQALKAIGH
eukprot:CAMPEP_0184699636 /NCGR_PEP_ID=MMETSP0313-20130426/5839_1 /TAXON_ID=2792 /ORGANISM="Porphyridium aerugineum, Strain SAG 1380-2" /LENGTH=120 /DNA_ID=CAMNT_0027158755 /DNA_START=130 /DNA_END=492 /DNA_ORIENTATION=+